MCLLYVYVCMRLCVRACVCVRAAARGRAGAGQLSDATRRSRVCALSGTQRAFMLFLCACVYVYVHACECVNEFSCVCVCVCVLCACAIYRAVLVLVRMCLLPCYLIGTRANGSDHTKGTRPAQGALHSQIRVCQLVSILDCYC